jgi:N-acetylglucosaminyldiphosphoundecaprenol N-acetyl-beta-D-mannosaminyltransferase
MTRRAQSVLGVKIPKRSLQEIIELSLQAIAGGRRGTVFACANPHSLVQARRDPEVLAALNRADLVVADGVGLAVMARLVGRDIGPRITGSDYFHALMGALERRGHGRVFFFGSSQRVLERIRERCAREFPHLELCGTLSPPYGEWPEETDQAMVELINAAKPDVVWVGMTAPKQELWVERNRDRLEVPVIASVGAVFDFFAGTYPRAPSWMCRLGIEWLFRLLREPRRMWRRNFISSPLFVGLVIWRHLLGHPGSA